MTRALMRGSLRALVTLLVVCAAGCGKDTVAPGHGRGDQAPETELTFGPVQGDTVSFSVHFYWNGYDADGEVVAFRWITDPDPQLAVRPVAWHRTTARDTTILFSVDPIDFYRRHVFMIAAEDNEGSIDPTPASRWFAAKTLPPVSKIEKGPILRAQSVAFAWSGVDPDGGQLGQLVTAAPVDSFQYLLLRAGAYGEMVTFPPPWHQPLPEWTTASVFYDIIGRAVGDTLPYPYGDWHWTGIRGTQAKFSDLSPGHYVFAIRAVDAAGATEQGIVAGAAAIGAHVRDFSVPIPPPTLHYPLLAVRSSLLRDVIYAQGPVDLPRQPLELFEEATISFSWSADASAYGGQVAGYSYALDDPSAVGPSYDPQLLGVTFGSDRLTPGSHVLFVASQDDGGHVTLAAIPILIVHPSFRDPGAAREILLVDDSLSPGNTPMANGGFPSDATETSWYLYGDAARPPGETMLPRIAQAFPGVTYSEWDTYVMGAGGVEGRIPPGPRDLSTVSTVIWVTDANNTTSYPVALWKTLVGGNYSALSAYLRAGGTLVVTGYNLVNDSTTPNFILSNRTAGLCASFAPGSYEWKGTYFPRLYMGVDYVVPNEDGRRILGARDFVAAVPTPAGQALGFDTAYVDTGATGTGAKWNTLSNLVATESYLDLNLAPGLPRIEGWVMAAAPMSFFGCQPILSFGRENGGAPIAQPIYAYHGVPRGVALDGGPSPREGKICGILAQSHDLGTGTNDTYPSTTGTYVPSKSVGRLALLGFPLYFIKNQQASDVLFKAFTYVNGSPTLP